MKKHHLVDYMKHWNDTAKLQEEFGIYAYPHPNLPLVLFKYDQIESPKMAPIVRQSRSTVLEKDTWDLVSLGFTRFFNWGEDFAGMDEFKWDNFFVNEKIDGSYFALFNYKDEWHINLSGSWGFQEIIEGTGKSWRDLILPLLNLDEPRRKDYLNKNHTYIFEFVSPYNKVVREYEVPDIYLLSIMHHEYEHPYELSPDIVDYEARDLCYSRPQSYNFNSYKEIEEFLAKKEDEDKTYEGVVIRDNANTRFKIKSKMYLTLHNMKGNGGLAAPKNILPWVLKGEEAELICYFKEFEPLIMEMKEKVNKEYENLKQVWKDSLEIKEQKDFALYIVPKTKFSGLLFDLRKNYGIVQVEDNLRKKWLNSEDLIIKIVCPKEKKNV